MVINMSIHSFCKIVLLLSISLPLVAVGQISRGGIPIQIEKLKSALPNSDLIVLPTVNNQ